MKNCEDILKDHSTYRSAVSELKDWLDFSKARLGFNDEDQDVAAVQNRLDKLEVSPVFL